MSRIVAAALLAFAAPALAAPTRAHARAEKPVALILISIDGLRWDYPERYGATRLVELGREGVRAEGLIPCFPTKTFPNHYTLVTGLYPEKHGIVGNEMFDPELGATFSISDRESMLDPRWWGGEPLWVTAERQGLATATMFWPGSEVEIEGVRPSTWMPYDASFPDEERVERVLAWLDREPDERPAFITLYFSRVDLAGHLHGPRSEEVAAAVREVDRNLGRLLDGLERRELTDRVDVVVVSDHGMAELDHDRMIVLEDHVELARDEVVSLTPLLGVWPEPSRVERLVRTLDAVPHVRAWKREDLPERFHWRHHPRIPPVVALADEGWRIVRRDELEDRLRREPGGGHGFDNRLESMRGVFFARGPSFRAGFRTPAFEGVHVHALLVVALGLESPPTDADLTVVEPLLDPGSR